RPLWKRDRRDEGGRRAVVPAAAPCPLGGVDMGESIADRPEAAAQVPGQLLGGQTVSCRKHAITRPVVIVEQRAQLLQIHIGPPPSPGCRFPYFAKRLRATNSTFAGRSASRRMYHGNQCSPYEMSTRSRSPAGTSRCCN